MVKEELNLELLSRYLDNDLPEEEQKKVEQLVADSPEARRQLEAMRRMLETMGRLPDHVPPPGFMERFEQRLPPGKSRLKNWLTLGFLPMPVRALAVVLIMTGGTVLALRSQKDAGRWESIPSRDKGVSITREDRALQRQKSPEEPPAAPAPGLGYVSGGIEKRVADTSREPKSLARPKPQEERASEQTERIMESSGIAQEQAKLGMPGMRAPGQENKVVKDEMPSPERAAAPMDEFADSAPQVQPQEQQILLESARRSELPASSPATQQVGDSFAFSNYASEKIITIKSASPAETFSEISEWLKRRGRSIEMESPGNQDGNYQLVFLATPEEASAIQQGKANFFQGKETIPVSRTLSEGDIHRAGEEKDTAQDKWYFSASESSATESVRGATVLYSPQATAPAFDLEETESVRLEKITLIFESSQ